MKYRYKKATILESLLIIYLFIGMMRYPILKYLGMSISLLIQLYVIIKIVISRRSFKAYAVPWISYGLILLIGFNFILLDVQFADGMSRVLRLISIFGISWVMYFKDKINIKSVIRCVIRLYKYLAIVIIIDAAVYKLVGRAIWEPIQYLESRFAGPMGDPNYMGMLFACLLIICFFWKETIKVHISTIIVFLCALFLSGSWSAVLITLGVLIFHSIFTIKHIFVKQIILLVIYCVITCWMFNNESSARGLFVDIFDKLHLFDEQSLNVKFNSLFIRIDTQMNAMKLSFGNILGYGPRTILKYFVHDTHNSFVAILFEIGLLGFILLLINVPLKSNSKLLDAISSVVIVSAFVLDIHYTIIYSFFILLSVFEKPSKVVSSIHGGSIYDKNPIYSG